MNRKIATSIILLLSVLTVNAEHIIGGEMYYECVGGNEYLVTMKLYRDCNSSGAVFDNPATFAVFDENNGFITTFTRPVSDVMFIEPDLSSPCLSFPPDVCVQEGIYEFFYEFPNNTQTYQLVYQRCCRNATILNLTDPGAQGLTILAEFPAADVADCNSRPSYNNFPPPVLCAQENLIFDHSATDLDGDSLAYSLCSPYIGGTQAQPMPTPPSAPPYEEVDWAPGFNAEDPITGNPGLSIDPITGELTGVPTVLGQYVVGVCVEEWRDGVLLSVNTRDFQFNVAVCEPTSEAIIQEPAIEDLCDDLTFEFENESAMSNTFLWDFGDPTTDDDISTSYNATYTYPDTGVYVVTLITNAGFFCSDTATLELPLFYENSIEVEISGFECVDGEQVFSFEADGNFDQENGVVEWDFGPNSSPQNGSGLVVDGVTFSTTGDQQVTVEVLNNICTAEDVVTINIPEPPQATIDSQDIFCNGLNYQFTHQSENASIYFWDFGDPTTTSDNSNQASAGYTFPEPGAYTVSLTVQNPDNCPITVTEDFEFFPLLDPEIADTEIACLDNNSIDFEADGSYTASASFLWEFSSANPATSTAENPTNISFEAAGSHPVSLTITENGCTRTAETEMIVHQNPTADFSTNLPEGCAPLDFSFSNTSVSESSSVSYLWDFGDGNTSPSRNVVHTYTNPGTYTVSLYLENLNGCIDSDQIVREDLVTVLPSPTANFRLDPNVVSAINPTLEITDLSEGNTTCSYFFDGQLFEECQFEHLLENVEPQTITLTVSNEFGCTDRIEGQILISDHLIFIPNAFTPDGDGLNDLFKPETSGVVKMEMTILNRWGEVIYTNNDERIGWNGSGPNSNYFAQPGVYQYIIRITDNLGWNFDYTGSVRLLR
ncbi:MAG TPA: PKD domain-containing protein [Cryomorphaceae bacterium]|nr:PKD domain-containing protein [Cryomorphaceae bacterium]